MAEFGAPSFSLGLDLDTQPDPQFPTRDLNQVPQYSSTNELQQEEVMDSDLEPGSEPTRLLKRLRRGSVPGPTAQSTSSSVKKPELEPTFYGDGDEDIEEFSSQEDLLMKDEHRSTQYRSMCTSSKIPLHGSGSLTTQSSSQCKARKREQASDAPSAGSLATSRNGLLFPKLTISPLRRFQLLDSDSDDPSVVEDVSRGAHKIGLSSKEPESTASKQKLTTSPLGRFQLLDSDSDLDLDSDDPSVIEDVSRGAHKIGSSSKEPESTASKQKLTASPLRRFQLLDSDSDLDLDSDDPSVSEDVNRGAHKIGSSSKEPESTASKQKRNVLVDGDEDLWKDFCPTKSLHIPTPILDEVCKEYFQSAKDKNAAQKLWSDVRIDNNKGCNPNTTYRENLEQCWDSTDPLPPAHFYFFHDDPRIQKLVRSRLPNFSPIGVVDSRGNQQSGASVIDYMSQFSNGEASKQKGTQKGTGDKSSARRRNRSKQPNAAEVYPASGGWMDPKSSSSIPKDAGKRRVHANGESAGHWFTSQEGKKVYISRNGQEFMGQMAYKQYKKESGGFSKKSKKRTTGKKRKAKS